MADTDGEHFRGELIDAPRQVFWPGLSIVVFGLFLHWVGARVQQPRLSLMSLVVLLWSIPLFLNGRKVGAILLFPCFYLIFCIPMNFFDSFSFVLRIIANVVSTAVLNGLGIAVERSGSAMYFVNMNKFGLDVADPCSGIRSLLAMTALTAAYAYFTQRVFWKQVVLFVSAIPLAIAGNIARITSIGIVVQLFGQDRAMKFYHDYSGYIVFVAAILIMFAIEAGLNRIKPMTKACAGMNGIEK
jgi:exosortase